MMELRPGLALGQRFVLVRRVAESAGAQVWLAEDREFERRVALKIIDAGILAQAGAAARLEAELERSRRLPPASVVAVDALHEVDGLTLLSMEYLPGGDLSQFRGRPFRAFLPALTTVAATLAQCHDQGLVHRDVKCGNVLLDAEGRARLADFGLATLTGLRSAGGSPYNASPQQLRGEPATPADDCYAFGAMLYELLSGYPPFYPDITRERVLREPVPPLVPRFAAPERLRTLALRLLAKSPAERPGSMARVHEELLAAAEDEVDEERPVAATLTGKGAVRTPAAPASRRRWLVAVAGLGLVAAAAVVFLWLPEVVGDRSDETGRDVAAAAQAGAERARLAAETAEERAAARTAAEVLRDRFAERLAGLEAQAAATWGAADLARARQLAASALRSYDLAEFDAAGAAWQEGLGVLDALDAARPAALAAALERGAAAIARGQSAAAAEAYGLALEIDPADEAAARGLERAGRLDEVLALVDTAAADERAGRIAQAVQGYRRALDLDAEAPGAAQALARIEAGRAAEAFAATMSRGLAALADGRVAAAESAFREAAAMRPGAAEPREALERLARDQRATGLAAIEERALAAERAERWVEAEKAWSEALAIEPALAAAQAGLERVRPRVRLAADIDGLVDKPERLWDAGVRAAARGLVAAARRVDEPRARLVERADELERLVAAAETPVQLVLRSDGITEVVIYRVGRIGSFQSHEVELLPGRYAVVGTRTGYRDVRRDVVILPGQVPPPVEVRAEEPI